MIYCIFAGNRMVGYATVPYSSSNKAEVITSVTEESLTETAGENWRNEYEKLILVDGKIEVDEDWTPEQEEEAGE